MLRQLRTRGFRGFRSLDAELAKVTAFLGPNSSGKTTALHAVRLACELLGRAIARDAPLRVREGQIEVASGAVLERPEDLLALLDWRALFLDQHVEIGSHFSLTLEFEPSDPIQRLDARVTFGNNEQLKLTVRVASSQALAKIRHLGARSPSRSGLLHSHLAASSPIAVFVPPFYGTVRSEEARSRVVVDRLLGAGDQSHVIRNLVASLSTDQFTQLNAFLLDTLGARVEHRTQGDALQTSYPLRVEFRDSNGSLELSAAGAGLINLISLYSSLCRWQTESVRRPVLFLLDEPEAHLHPRLQAESAERIARLVTQDFGAQLLLATHSVDILNRLSEKGARLLRCDRNATPSLTALDHHSSLFDDLAGWVDLTPYTAINFLASRRVLFCEGPGDATALRRLAAMRYRNDPSRLARFQRWSIVRLEGASNRPIASLLARLVRNDVVRASARGDMRIVVVLDRDHARNPGVRTHKHDGVVEIEVVWGRHSIESVLLDPAVLAAWIGAMLGEFAPQDLPSRIEQALVLANESQVLNDAACEQLAAQLVTGELFDEHGTPLSGAQKFVHAQRRARELVRSAPEVWQHGKSRAATVLGELRRELPTRQRNQFPTDILRLLERVDVHQLASPAGAVPSSIGELLELLTADDA